MKAACIILALATVAALAFGLTAAESLGALEAQVADLTAQLNQARTDLALSEEINRAFEKERATLQETVDELQSEARTAQPPAAAQDQAPDQMDALKDAPAA